MNITSCTLTSHIAKSFKAYHTIRTPNTRNNPKNESIDQRSNSRWSSTSFCRIKFTLPRINLWKNRSIQLSSWKPSQTSCLVFRRPRSLSRRAAAERKGRVVVSLPVSRRQKSRWEPALSRSPACVANAHAHVERTRACEHTARTQPRTHTSKRVAARAT